MLVPAGCGGDLGSTFRAGPVPPAPVETKGMGTETGRPYLIPQPSQFSLTLLQLLPLVQQLLGLLHAGGVGAKGWGRDGESLRYPPSLLRLCLDPRGPHHSLGTYPSAPPHPWEIPPLHPGTCPPLALPIPQWPPSLPWEIPSCSSSPMGNTPPHTHTPTSGSCPQPHSQLLLQAPDLGPGIGQLHPQVPGRIRGWGSCRVGSHLFQLQFPEPLPHRHALAGFGEFKGFRGGLKGVRGGQGHS